MLVSIHPRFADQIMVGNKTVELRKSRPSAVAGQPVAVYSTSPRAAIVALCRVVEIDSGLPSEIWDRVGDRAGVTRQDFDRYFDGCRRAFAIHLGDVERLEVPISLDHLRAGSSFHPPQTWHYLNTTRVRELTGTHPSGRQLRRTFAAASA
jgi:predicted transcriptional regulator